MVYKKIESKRDLKDFISKDYDVQGMKTPLLARLTWGENWALFSYMRNLRFLEYHINRKKKCKKSSLYFYFHSCAFFYHLLIHRWNCKSMGIYIMPNSVGPGFHMVHRGFRHLLSSVRIGSNCEILPMVLMGKKRPDINNCPIIIGDNCYISTGVTILGPITIGNNVTIAAGAVVTQDVPDNVIVGGIPAKIIKYKM